MLNSLLDTEPDYSEHFILVKKVASHLHSRLPKHISFNDLVQSGMLGLLEAYEKYNTNRNISFEKFAYKRIHGEMIDFIRKSDWAPRRTRKIFREAAEARHRIESVKHTAATEREIADEMKISLKDYQNILRDASIAQIFNVEDEPVKYGYISDLVNTPTPADDDYKNRLKDDLTIAINNLNERERTVLSFYYQEEMKLKEIGAVLGVSESRACQILGSAILTLQAKLKEWID